MEVKWRLSVCKPAASRDLQYIFHVCYITHSSEGADRRYDGVPGLPHDRSPSAAHAFALFSQACYGWHRKTTRLHARSTPPLLHVTPLREWRSFTSWMMSVCVCVLKHV